MRSTTLILRFGHPFRLAPLEHEQPAGSYRLVTEEERLEGLSFDAYKRVATLLYLPALPTLGTPTSGRAREVIDVDPAELAMAVVADALQNLGAPAKPA